MPVRPAQALAVAMAAEDPALPGVNGEAAPAAALAGHWTELTKRPTLPWQGQRLYEARQVSAPSGVALRVRPAKPPDRDLLVEWLGDRGGAGAVGASSCASCACWPDPLRCSPARHLRSDQSARASRSPTETRPARSTEA